MKNETRYIVSDAVSIPVIRIVSKGEAYRMATKPGWGLVEWYSAEDGYNMAAQPTRPRRHLRRGLARTCRRTA